MLVKVSLQPLYSQLNPGVGNCPLGCDRACQIRQGTKDRLSPPPGHSCPLSTHQAQTCAEIQSGQADIIFNTAATGDGKSLGAYLPSLLDPGFRVMGLYPTIELTEDQYTQQQGYHKLFKLDAGDRVDRLFGEELARRVKAEDSHRFLELRQAIYHKPILLTNPDIFHYITHYQYRHPAYGTDELPTILAEWPDLWVFDEFPIFGAHQEAAVLNSLSLIRNSQQLPKRFLFTSATPKPEFVEYLQRANFTVRQIEGTYANRPTPGYRPILQPTELEFVQLRDTDTFHWLTDTVSQLRSHLTAESCGRGLIVLNSVALAARVTPHLQELLPDVAVREISGRIDRKTRSRIQAELQQSPQPVLVVGTSAVDVGVDFQIHLLICESSDSATVIQRLGRLGRHPGFSSYRAFVLVPGHAPWIMSRLEERLDSELPIDRATLNDAIRYAFDSPQDFQEYRQCWGALQVQGMLDRMRIANPRVTQTTRDRIGENLKHVYGDKLESKRKAWFALGNSPKGKAIQSELLRFRGSSALQAGVWDGVRFYIYDLLRLIPYVTADVIDRAAFLEAATSAGYGEEAFPEPYLQAYLRVREWTRDRAEISLHCNRRSERLQVGELVLLDRLRILGHPQSDLETCLSRRKLLAFLVPVEKRRSNSHWDVSRKLNLTPLFGLYRLVDASEEAYACAFNQDALLLKALGRRLKKFYRTRFESSIF